EQSYNLWADEPPSLTAGKPVSSWLGEADFLAHYHLFLGGRVTFLVVVPLGRTQATFSTSWPGSDIVMSLKSPAGRRIDRQTIAGDVHHEVGPNFEVYAIPNPEPGAWEVSLYGADVPPNGEDVTFGFSTLEEAPLPPPQLAEVVGGTLILNIGSKDRREARHIETDVTDEKFTVCQLSAALAGEFSVSAFGLTQVYSGVLRIQADADDGNDAITLEPCTNGSVFTAPAEITGGSGDDQITSGDGADTLSGGADR